MALPDIYQSYNGKSIFFTGVTGFVGKVLLFKILKEFPDLKSIFVLIRTKKKQSPMQRFEKEILSSPCFAPLIAEIGQDEWKRRISKIVPVSGDILVDGLGLSAEDTQKITSSCNVVIHLAATVDFMEKINMSVKMNVLGTLRVMALAKKCPNIEAVVHTSTCYVNWNRNGKTPVKETLYPIPFDAEAMVKYILSLSDVEVPKVQEKLLNEYRFPNTYTFTKRMTEHILESKYRNQLPLTIVRPAIIGASWREPVPGWVDALTAAGGIFLTAGLGILRELQADPENIADIVPVDYVVNTLLKAGYKCMHHLRKPNGAAPIAAAPVPKPVSVPVGDAKSLGAMSTDLSSSNAALQTAPAKESESVSSEVNVTMPFTFQSCTSGTMNPCYWGTCQKAVVNYWQRNPHEKQIGKPDIVLTPSIPTYWFRYFVYRKIPLEGMKFVSGLPAPLGDPKKAKLVKRYERAVWRASDLNFQFKPFTLYEWRYESENTRFLDEGMDSCPNFRCDVYDINWVAYVEYYCYGMIKYIMRSEGDRQPPAMPLSGSQQFLKASL